MTRIDHEILGRDASRAPDAAWSDLADEIGRTPRLAVGTLSRLELVIMGGREVTDRPRHVEPVEMVRDVDGNVPPDPTEETLYWLMDAVHTGRERTPW